MFSKLFTTVKYSLVSVNFLFVITGIIVLSVGISVQSAYNGYHPFLSDRFFSLPAFCIATGIIVFLIASFGFYGAFMENYWMCMAFVGAMIMMFIFQLSGCIAGYALRGNTVALLQKELFESMDLYGTGEGKSVEVTALWDEVQKDFSCCGVTNATDWLTPLHLNNSIPEEEQGLPMSCCPPIAGTTHTMKCIVGPGAYQVPCAEAFGNFIRSHAGSIAVSGVFLVLMQGTAVAGAFWMAKILREERGAYP